ncbi:uncharacterized protein LOC141626754 [Silene latifolia]|uniref:uncharacterized protein LOC141626754 n=1 Tax=Silene latifolia TaxID=37657 RepID=UPI003D7759C3
MEDVISKGGNNKVQQIGEEAATTLAIHEKEVSVNEIQKDQVPNNASEVVTTKADQVNNGSEKEMQLDEKTADGKQHTSPSSQFPVFSKAVNKRPVILADPNRIEKPHVRVGRGLVENKSAAAETVVHGEKLLPNHRIVEITTVNPGHENFQLPVPVRDDITILGDALGSFIQWPDTHIYLAKISPNTFIYMLHF